jgi:filamentous hemagglutinin
VKALADISTASGQYTTHNGDGTFKQYRGSGKPHGGIPRPNVKENTINNSPNGPIPGSPTVRPAQPEEIPKGK